MTTVNKNVNSRIIKADQFDKTGFASVSSSSVATGLSSYLKDFKSENRDLKSEYKKDFNLEIVQGDDGLEFYFSVPKDYDEKRKTVSQLSIVQWLIFMLNGKIKYTDKIMSSVQTISSGSYDKLSLLYSFVVGTYLGNKMNVRSEIKDMNPILVRTALKILKLCNADLKDVPANLIVETTKLKTYKAIFPDVNNKVWNEVYGLIANVLNVINIEKDGDIYNHLLGQVYKGPRQILEDKNIKIIKASTGNCDAARRIMVDDVNKLITSKLKDIRSKSGFEQIQLIINNIQVFTELKESINSILSPNKDINLDLVTYNYRNFYRQNKKNSREKRNYIFSNNLVDKTKINIYNPFNVLKHRGCGIIPIQATTHEMATRKGTEYINSIQDKISDISMDKRNALVEEFASLSEYLLELEVE